jgi:VWFA-related protein
MPLFAQTPTFQSGTRLVEVTAVVRDRQGKTSGGLTADDFEISDAGRRQVISHFAVEKLQHDVTRFMGDRTPAPGKERINSALPDRFIAFVLDDQNLVPEHFPQATLAAIRHLEDLRPGDRAAVAATSGRMVQPFTGDRDKLREALSKTGSLGRRVTFDVSLLNSEITCQITYWKADRIRDGDPASLQNCVPPAGAPVPALPTILRPGAGGSLAPPGDLHRISLENQVRAFAESIVQAGDRDVQNYFSRLAELIETMSRMPGERSILLLSPGMYIAPRFHHLQDSIIADAVRAKVVISGVDPRGVYLRNDQDDPSTWTDAWGLAETQQRVSFMENVASGTGGNFIRGDNDVTAALRVLDSVPEFVYILGFSPSPLKLDGSYHPLKVSLRRSRGLSVAARRGYYAANMEPAAAGQVPRPAEDAFFSGHEYHEIPVKLQIRSSQVANAGRSVLTAAAFIDLHPVQFHKETAVNRAGLKMGVGVFDENGTLVKDQWKELDLHPEDSALERLLRAGIDVTTDFTVLPGRYLVRVLIHDPSGGAMGTSSVGVTIRP